MICEEEYFIFTSCKYINILEKLYEISEFFITINHYFHIKLKNSKLQN